VVADNGVNRLVRCLCALATAALTTAITMQVSAADQPKPILRIETAGHNSRMNDAATDRAGHLLLTVGNDKTARMWSLPDLRPIGVLRPAIGPRAEGTLYAVAISPDGAVAAVGGYLAEVLLFDLRSRNILHRWADLPDSVLSLAFSPDGSRLAIGLGAQGVRILRVADGTVLAEDRDFTDGVYGLDFASDGRLAASSPDGDIRL
jgi:WD40 repeat protein